jgi:hypothetical protein
MKFKVNFFTFGLLSVFTALSSACGENNIDLHKEINGQFEVDSSISIPRGTRVEVLGESSNAGTIMKQIKTVPVEGWTPATTLEDCDDSTCTISNP